MSATHRIGLLLLVGIAFVLGNTFAGAQGGKAKDEGYEYRIAGDLGRKLGEDGWELIAVAPSLDGEHFLFRRPATGEHRKWEAAYEDVAPIDQKDLQDRKGWEFVSMTNSGRAAKSQTYFKRMKQ